MKRLSYFVVTFLLISVTILGQTFVSDWGSTPRGVANWTILNTATTPAGSGSMGGTEKPSGWTSIKGGFAPLTATTTQAFVITGTFEFVGGGGNNAYTWLRFALFNGDGELTNKNTPTAAWSETSNGNGYIFTPRTGTGEISNTYNTWPEGNRGTNWPLINSKSWTSTNSNGGGPYATVLQAPSRQVAVAGVYDWAISVQPKADGTNEVRWYLVQQHAANSQNYYWWGGSFIDDRVKQKVFNSIGFAINNDVDATVKQVNLTNVKVSLGTQITVPTAPWQAYYVDDWGNTPRGTAWPILNTADYLVGNAAMGADKKPSGWASIKGGFRETHTPTLTKALIVTGTFEMVGGTANNAYTWLRYALTYQDNPTLSDKNTPTAAWAGGNHWGYEFTPRTGVGEVANGSNGVGTIWTIPNSAGWNSTYSGQVPLAKVLQAPARAVATAGIYDWAISVQPLADGSNEIRWYLIKRADAGKQTDYWYAGIAIDRNPVTTKFNGICFSMNNDVDETLKQMNLGDVKVDMGNPITVPDPPFKSYYIDTWGFVGNRTNGWTITPGEVIGNFSVAGSTPPYGFVAVRGGFDYPVIPTADKAILITGQMEFVGGGFDLANSLRYGLFYTEAPGTLTNRVWSTSENNTSGYLFLAPSGKNGAAEWGLNKYGTFGGIVNGTWLIQTGQNNYPLSSQLQLPQNMVAGAGKYDFAISIQPKSGGMEIKQYLIKTDKSYYWAGTIIDGKSPLPVTKFNSVNFAFFPNKATALNFYDLKVDLGNPITIPPITSVEEVEGLPIEYALNQNYPNPFNPTTTIEFALPKSGEVNLVVYDILGRVVKELVSGVFEAGNHKVNFNATNLASGIYFYKLKAGDFVSVKKLTLLK